MLRIYVLRNLCFPYLLAFVLNNFTSVCFPAWRISLLLDLETMQTHVLVFAGYCNRKTPDWIACKQNKLISHSSGAWNSWVRVKARLGSGGSLLLLGVDSIIFVSSHDREPKEKKPFMGLHPHDLS